MYECSMREARKFRKNDINEALSGEDSDSADCYQAFDLSFMFDCAGTDQSSRPRRYRCREVQGQEPRQGNIRDSAALEVDPGAITKTDDSLTKR